MRVATTVIIGGMKDSSPMAILHNKKEKKEKKERMHPGHHRRLLSAPLLLHTHWKALIAGIKKQCKLMANSRGSESSNVSSFSILAFIPNTNCLGGCYSGDNPLAFNDQLTILPSLGEHVLFHKHTLHFE